MAKQIRYPKITKENFEELTDRLVHEVRFWNKRWKSNDIGKVIKVRAPRTRNEFFRFTRDMYGIGLTFRGSFGRYEIREKYDDYSKGEIAQMWAKKYENYDALKIFLSTAFGLLGTGGVAGSHYGDYKTRGRGGHRAEKRIEKMHSSVLSIRSKPAFNRRKT